MYSIEQIKKAFWYAFHKKGEIFFDYLDIHEDNEKEWNDSTSSHWDDLKDALQNIGTMTSNPLAATPCAHLHRHIPYSCSFEVCDDCGLEL